MNKYQQGSLFKIKRKSCADVWLLRWYGAPRHYVTWIYNPSVNSRIVNVGVHMFSTEYGGRIGAIGAFKAHNSAKSSAKFCVLKKLS
jgi:hypothetical protein